MSKKAVFEFLFFDQGQSFALVVDPSRIQQGQGFPQYVLDNAKGSRLKLDFDPTWPMQTKTNEAGVTARFSFNGQVSTCFISWETVLELYIGDRITESGWLGETQAPPKEAPKGNHLKLV